MRLVWLLYEQDGHRAVVIERAWSIIAARLRASIAHDLDSLLLEAHELPAGAEVPPGMVGSMLSARQAARVIEGLQPGRGAP